MTVLLVFALSVIGSFTLSVGLIRGYPVLVPFRDWADQIGFKIVVVVPLLSFLVIIVHELGHLILGLCVGFRLSSIRFGPVQISPPFRVSWQRERRSGSAGLVRMLPVQTENLRARAIIFILGGAGANILAGWLTLYAASGMVLFKTFAALSIVIGGANLLPFTNRTHYSDGKRILMLLRNRKQGERWLAVLRLADDLYNGIDPENLSPEFLARVTAFTDDTPDTVSAFAIAFTAAWYRSDAGEAARLLETCLKYSGFSAPMMRQVLQCDAAVFQARKRKRAAVARQWLDDVPENSLMPGLRLRGEAAILEAEGDIPGALHKLDEYEKTVLTLNDRYQRIVSLRFLQRWRNELLETNHPVET